MEGQIKISNRYVAETTTEEEVGGESENVMSPQSYKSTGFVDNNLWDSTGLTPEDGRLTRSDDMYGEDYGYSSQYQKKKKSYVSALMKFANLRFHAPEIDEEAEVRLTIDMIQMSMSRIGRAIDSTEMAYLKFECRGKGLQNIDALQRFIHVRNVDLSENNLRSLDSLAPLIHLQVLNVQMNDISSFLDIPELIWLQALNLKKNLLETMDGIRPNFLTYLNLSNNRLDSTKYFIEEIFPNLLLLELRGNEFSSMAGLDLPKLRHLYIGENRLTDLEGLEGCPDLELVHARENLIFSLANFPNLTKLKYINLRMNHIRRFTETIFLGNSENLETVVLVENPICESVRYRSEMLAAVLTMARLDKTLISEIERVEGRHLRSGRNMGVIPPLEDDYTIAATPAANPFEGEGGNE